MGTKNNPGKWDCYENAEPDEPMFVLLGRDPTASVLVNVWRSLKARMVKAGTSSSSEEKLREAEVCASAMETWTKGKGKDPLLAIAAFNEILGEVRNKKADYLEAGLRSLIAHHAETAEEEQRRIDTEFVQKDDKLRERMIGKVKVRRLLAARLQDLLDGNLLVAEEPEPGDPLVVLGAPEKPERVRLLRAIGPGKKKGLGGVVVSRELSGVKVRLAGHGDSVVHVAADSIEPDPRPLGKCDCCYSPGDEELPMNVTRYDDGGTEHEQQLCDVCDARPF